jgi:hypothetical protein
MSKVFKCRVLPFDVQQVITATSVQNLVAQLRDVYPGLHKIGLVKNFLTSPEWNNCLELEHGHWAFLPETVVVRVDVAPVKNTLRPAALDKIVWAMNGCGVSVQKMGGLIEVVADGL